MAPTIGSHGEETTNLMDFVVTKGHGVKGLSEKGLLMVPRQYIQPLEERIDMENVVSSPSVTSTATKGSGGGDDQYNSIVPIIDVTNIDVDPKVGDAICDAAEKWGFFQVINHGVPEKVIDEVMDGTRDFFGLPAEVKNNYSKDHSVTNNVRYGTSFVPDAESSLEWKDYLSLFFTSQQEAKALWPPQCRDQALNYLKWSEPIINKLLRVLMMRLKVKEIDETKSSLLMGSRRINLNYYPKCPNPELTVGVGRHSDISTLTFLLQDTLGGLFVRDPNNMSWVPIPPVTGSIVVNVGDALQILSNGRYKSVEHRVVAHENKNRVSVPIFINPRPTDMIGPLPELIENGEKPIYKQVLYSDYAKHFFKKAHDGKKTIDFAAI